MDPNVCFMASGVHIFPRTQENSKRAQHLHLLMIHQGNQRNPQMAPAQNSVSGEAQQTRDPVLGVWGTSLEVGRGRCLS